jgi:hypothetical protein
MVLTFEEFGAIVRLIYGVSFIGDWGRSIVTQQINHQYATSRFREQARFPSWLRLGRFV